MAPSMRLARTVFSLGLAILLSGCFRPMYGESTGTGGAGPGVRDNLRSIEVAPVLSVGSRLPRVGGKVRDELIFLLTGGGDAGLKKYKLTIGIAESNLSLNVDIATGRSDVQVYGIGATYSLTDIESKKVVLTSSTFSRATFEMPGGVQQFARYRALRDAENRAANEIAQHIQMRLASHFAGGT